MPDLSVRGAVRYNSADTAFRELRTGILRGEYRANERLVEADLADSLGVSRTPVREALLRLQAEGLVVRGRQGFHVREFLLSEIIQIYEVRAALEGFAARLSAERATAEACDELKCVLENHTAEIADGASFSSAKFIRINDEFHDSLVASCQNARLVAATQRNRLYFLNFRHAAGYSVREAESALEEHRRIFDAVKVGDVDRAEQLTRKHITEALSAITRDFA